VNEAVGGTQVFFVEEHKPSSMVYARLRVIPACLTMSSPASLVAEFQTRFGAAPRLFRAPGRVNLIGEHTDYMDGLCLPIAVDRSVTVAAAPRADGRLELHSKAFGSAGPFDLASQDASDQRSWHDAIRGVAAVLRRTLPLNGANVLIDSDLPIGGGMSSSAAVAVGTARALLALSRCSMTPLELSMAVREAENEFAGARSGLLDPLAITSARARHAVLIDCRSGGTTLVPFDDAAVLVFDTRTKHDLAGSGYNQRRAECEAGLQLLETYVPGLETLRDIDSAGLSAFHGRIPSPMFERVRHVVLENERVLAAVEALRRRDMPAFGTLMFESHRSLSGDYAVSTPELDWTVSELARLPGAFGAKMTGGGFGGCVVALVDAAALEHIASSLRRGYQQRFGIIPDAYRVYASDGEGEITGAEE
jgi:galactokinase